MEKTVRKSMKRGDESEATHLDRTRRWTGIPEMKATSFLVVLTRTPMCQLGIQPGGLRALGKGQARVSHGTSRVPRRDLSENVTSPVEELRAIVEAHCGVIVLNVVEREQVVDLLGLVDDGSSTMSSPASIRRDSPQQHWSRQPCTSRNRSAEGTASGGIPPYS